jgi:hypothetical protein
MMDVPGQGGRAREEDGAVGLAQDGEDDLGAPGVAVLEVVALVGDHHLVMLEDDGIVFSAERITM